MNILDENIPESQARLLHGSGIRARQIGRDIGRAGMQDEEIVTLLHACRPATFFTRDRDFDDPGLRHPAYSLVRLDCEEDEAAVLVRRVLRHPELNTFAKRAGTVVRASGAGVRIWRRDAAERVLPWPER
ncbi:MAG: hypothetical protein M3O34_05510 [Chloroflexota bacterium]|nr:hypothetical protein [Chloroflexota bacterium]